MNETWHKSSYSASTNANCVEVAEAPHAVKVRDTQHPHLGHLVFPTQEWQAFLTELRTERL